MKPEPGSSIGAPDLPAGWERLRDSSGAWLAGTPASLEALSAAGFGPASDGDLAPGELGGRGTLGELSTELGPVLVRRYRSGGWLAPVRGERFGDPERALAEARLGLALRDRGVRTPEPVAVRARPHSRGGWRLELLVERRVAAVDLGRAWLEAPGAERRALERELGAFVAELHAVGLVHRDLHWRNLLVEPAATPGERLWIIDLDRGNLAAAPLERDARLAQWARFWRALDKRRRAGAPAPGATSAARALGAYLGVAHDAGPGDRSTPGWARATHPWLRAIHARLAWRRRLQRLRPRPRREDLRV